MGDSLTDLLRRGARGLIEKAVEAELELLLEQYGNVTDLKGRQAVVRNGYLPERSILTGLGEISVRVPKVRDRSGSGITFNSAIVPSYVRKARQAEAALPWLYLRGISTGDLREALSVLLGEEAQGLSPPVVSRLKAQWAEDYLAWNRRDLSGERSVYAWADGIYSTLRGEDDRLCLLILIGVNEQGEKRLLAWSDGYRESKASLARHAAGRAGAGPENAAGPAHRRRCLGFLGGVRGSLAGDPGPALLGAQDRQRAQRTAEIHSGQGQGRAPRELDGGNPGPGREGLRPLRRRLWCQVS
jgi:hypothetical protein